MKSSVSHMFIYFLWMMGLSLPLRFIDLINDISRLVYYNLFVLAFVNVSLSLGKQTILLRPFLE